MEKNTAVVFPAPLMSTIGWLTGFLTRESAASTSVDGNGAHEHALPRTARNR